MLPANWLVLMERRGLQAASGIPRHGYELVNAEGEQVGVVTSGTMSPTRKIGIGMGYVKPEYSKVGTEICIDMRGRKLKAVVVKPPFRK